MPNEIVAPLASYGLPGLMLALVVALKYRDEQRFSEREKTLMDTIAKKDAELASINTARVSDAQAVTGKVLDIQRELTDAIDRLERASK